MTFHYLCLIVLIYLFTISQSLDAQNKNWISRDTSLENYICIEEKTFPYAMVFILIFLTIFLLGLAKGIIGLICSRRIGMFGLNLLLDLPHPINCYYEPQLRNQKVIYDFDGWPIHPETHKRVRIINESSELCLNTVFFFAFPFFVFWVALQNACHCYENCDDSNSSINVSPMCQNSNEKTHLKSPNSCSSYCREKYNCIRTKAKLDTYKDENDTTEEKDTKYVLEQLSKSEGCLNDCQIEVETSTFQKRCK